MVGETEADNSTEDMELFTVSLSEGEHIQRLDLCQTGLIEKLKLTSNKGKVFEPLGYLGGPEINVQKYIKIHPKDINPKQMYLDGIRGNLTCPFGAKAINRISFKWSFVEDKMELPLYQQYQPLPPVRSAQSVSKKCVSARSEKISILDLEKGINLTNGVGGPWDRLVIMKCPCHVPCSLRWGGGRIGF